VDEQFDLTEMSSQSKTFDFVKPLELAPKPRDKGWSRSGDRTTPL